MEPHAELRKKKARDFAKDALKGFRKNDVDIKEIVYLEDDKHTYK